MKTEIKELVDYISCSAQEIDYSLLAGKKPVLFLGETHQKNPSRIHIADSAAQLKKACITHYAIEAPSLGQLVLDRLLINPKTDLSGISLGSEGGENYELAIRAVSSEGIKVRAIDIEEERNKFKDERENHMLESIRGIFREDPEAKVAILIGALHSRKAGFCIFLSTIPLAARLQDFGIDSLAARFICADESAAPVFNNLVEDMGLSENPFMIPLRNPEQFIPLGIDTCDYVIYLPSLYKKGPAGLRLHRFNQGFS